MGRFSLKRSNPKLKTLQKLTFLSGIRVKDPKGESILLSDLWKSQVVVLKVLRTFGCPLCRYESKLLSELKPEFDALNVRLCSIAFEDLGLEEFLNGGYWDWDIYIDKDMAVYKALELRKLSITAGLKNILSNSTRAAVNAAFKYGISGDVRGDNFQLGGTFVVNKGGDSLLYELRQLGVASYSSLKQIYQICGGDPDEVEEKAPKECMSYVEGLDGCKKCFY